MRESTLAVHVCEARRRRLERHERGVDLGFRAYLRFYETLQGSSRLRTFDDFADSPYYRAFVKFGRYCVNTRTINPERFTDWLVRNNKKIDRWASDQLYDQYLVHYLTTESAADALARGVEYAIDWAEKNSSQAHDLLRYGNDNAVTYAISTGRISAWIVYNCESGQKFLDEMNQDQIKIVWPWIDPEFWQKKFQDYPADHEYVKEMLLQAGW